MLIAKAEGYFTNNEEFNGPNRKEFLHITFEDGFWQGLKIVGDANVPRGKVSFTTTKKEANIENPTPAKIQVRAKFFWIVSSFHWMEGASVRFDSSTHNWYIMAEWLGGSFSFSRCTEQEAMDAAKGPDNA